MLIECVHYLERHDQNPQNLFAFLRMRGGVTTPDELRRICKDILKRRR